MSNDMGQNFNARAMAARIASGHMRRQAATLHAQLDAMARLQILEGALNLPTLPFSSQPDPTAALHRAQAYITDSARGEQIQAGWFEPGSVDVYNILSRRTRQALSGVSGVSVDDLIQSALGGLGKKGNPTKRPMWEAGRKLADKIVSGIETPEKMAAGVVGSFFLRKVLNEIATQRTREDAMGRPVNVGPADPSEDGHPLEQAESTETNWSRTERITYLLELIQDKHDPLAQQVRAQIRGIWAGWKPEWQEWLNWWLDNLVETGRHAGTAEIARHFMPDVPEDMVGKPGVPTPEDVIKWRRGLHFGELNRAWTTFTSTLKSGHFQVAFWTSPLGELLDARLDHMSHKVAKARIAAAMPKFFRR